MKPLDNEELYGFELQLTEIQGYLDNFSQKHARCNFAANKRVICIANFATVFNRVGK